MKKMILTLLASAALGLPAMVPAMAQNMPQNQPPAATQPQAQQPQAQQPQAQQPRQNTAQNQPQSQQKTSNEQMISPRRLSRNNVRQIQLALNKDGYQAGHVDGVWGPDTRVAVRNFQKSAGIQANGQLTRQTLSKLGVQLASNTNAQNQNNNNNGMNNNGMNKMPNQNGNMGSSNGK